MIAVLDAITALNAAVSVGDKIRTYTDPGAVFDPPAFNLGPPTLVWEGYTLGPTGATFSAELVVQANADALPALLALLPVVVEAIETAEGVDAAVTTATPTSVAIAPGAALPAYLLQIEVSL